MYCTCIVMHNIDNASSPWDLKIINEYEIYIHQQSLQLSTTIKAIHPEVSSILQTGAILLSTLD